MDGYLIIINNDTTPIDNAKLKELLNTPGFVAVVINGRYGGTSVDTDTNSDLLLLKYQSEGYYTAITRDDTTHVQATQSNVSIIDMTVADLGVNPIN